MILILKHYVIKGFYLFRILIEIHGIVLNEIKMLHILTFSSRLFKQQ